MDKIMQIYNSEYFTIGLFILIAILSVIFLILLLGGKKKNKNKKEDNLNDMGQTNTEPLNTEPINDSVNIPVNEINTIESSPIGNNNINSETTGDAFVIPPVEDNILESTNINNGLNQNLFDTQAFDNNVSNTNNINSMNNVNSMNSINNDLPIVTENQEVSVNPEPIIPDMNKPIQNQGFVRDEEVIDQNKMNQINNSQINDVSRPDQFSSVFVGNQTQNTAQTPINNQPVNNVNPAFDLPKLNEDSNNQNNNQNPY